MCNMDDIKYVYQTLYTIHGGVKFSSQQIRIQALLNSLSRRNVALSSVDNANHVFV